MSAPSSLELLGKQSGFEANKSIIPNSSFANAGYGL